MAALGVPQNDRRAAVAVWKKAVADGVADADVLRVILNQFDDPEAVGLRLARLRTHARGTRR